jgi:hypothetical protein
MNCLMLAATLAVGLDPQQPVPQHANNQTKAVAGQQGTLPATHLDGTWTILCAERDGQKMNAANETATIQGNILTWKKDGKEHRVQLQFGENHMFTARPEHQEHAAATQAQAGSRSTPKAATPEQPGQRPNQPAAAQNSAEQQPSNAVPAPSTNLVNGLAQQGIFAQAEHRAANVAATEHHATAGQMEHHGIYIFADNYLCLSFDTAGMGGMEEGTNANAAKPAAKANASQPAERTGQQAATTPGNATPKPQPATSQQAATPAGNARQAGTEPRAANAAPGTAEQSKVHQAGYAVPAAGAGMSQHGSFVLILRREKSEQR